MNKKLEKLKAMLRDSIAMAEAATPGPWKAFTNSSKDSGCYSQAIHNDVASTSILGCDKSEQNAAFIAHARTFHPMFSKMLLAAIVAHEAAAKQLRDYTEERDVQSGTRFASQKNVSEIALEAICRDLPEEVV